MSCEFCTFGACPGPCWTLPEQDTIAVVETGGNKVIDDGFCHGYDTQLVGRIIFTS